MKRTHLFWAVVLLLLCGLCAMPAYAEGDYDAVLDRLGRLQTLANSYVSQNGTTDDPVVLTLSYTRTGEYNSSIWQITAGTRDPGFESYVTENDADLVNLQGLGSVQVPSGESVDFGHLLASMNLVYNGIPITGSWGGDCSELAQAYAGQASDTAGYMSAMQATFALADDGTNSKFGDQDLYADLDSVVIGSKLGKDTGIADTMRDYYASLTNYNRCHDFIALSFGTVDTGDQAAFRDKVYTTMTGDSGMQLLLYMNGMWDKSSWSISQEAEAPMQGAAYLFADYLAQAVNNEKVKSDSTTLMASMGKEALASALSALGYEDAASAANGAAQSVSSQAAGSGSSGSMEDAVSDALTNATQKLKGSFSLSAFQLVLVVLGAAALAVLLGSIVTLFRHRR